MINDHYSLPIGSRWMDWSISFSACQINFNVNHSSFFLKGFSKVQVVIFMDMLVNAHSLIEVHTYMNSSSKQTKSNNDDSKL